MNEWDIAITALKDHGRAIFFGGVIGLVMAVLIVIFQPPVYEARMVIAPTERTGVPSLGSILPQNVADTPMIQYFVNRIDAATTSDFTLLETLLTGPRLASRLVETGSSSLPAHRADELMIWIKNHVKIRPVGTTPFRRITVRHTDPAQAVEMLSLMFQEADMMIRQDMRARTQRRLAYLKDQLDKTFHPDHKDAIIALMKEQEQTAMMVSIDTYFAARPVDGPALAPKVAAPDWRILIPGLAIGGMIGGLMIGGMVGAIRRA